MLTALITGCSSGFGLEEGVKTSWPMPMPSAAPTRARQGWTAGISRTSKRMGYSGGLANWRLRSDRRLTDRTLSEE
jgi:hypothetical protein